MAILDSNTTSAEATLTCGQPPDTQKALQDALMQAEGNEWPSQPFSSIQQHDQLEIRADNAKEHAAPALHKGQSPEMVEQESQHAPKTIPLLIRPTSSGEDPAAGFSFGRAPPMQVDFTRKKTLNTTGHTSSTGRPVIPQVEVGISDQDSPPSMQIKVTDTPASTPSNQPTLKLSSLPFPSVGINVSPKYIHPASPARQAPSEIHAPCPLPHTPPAQNEASMSAENTLVGSDFERMKDTRTEDDVSHGLDKPVDKSPILGYNPNVSAAHGHQQDNVIRPTGKALAQGAEANPRPRVTKTRRRKQSSIPIRGPHHGQNSPTEEDLLNVLLYKRKQAAVERERIEEIQQAKDTELQRSIEVTNELYAQLQDVSQRCSDKEAELSKIKACKPGWENKLKKLSEYVKGLSNDHNKLRDDAKLIREQQTSVLQDKNDLFGTLREVYQVTQEGNARSSQAVIESRHDLEMLELQMQHLQMKLREEEALLLSERLRSSHLEEEISTFQTGRTDLQDLFAEHREAITQKISDSLNAVFEHIQVTSPRASQDDLKPTLERCLTLIEALPKADGSAKSADIQQLEDSMLKCFEGITRSIEKCEYNTSTTESGQQQLALSIHKELRTLGTNISTEHTLSEEIMELREMRATVRERLHSSETALRDSRLQVVALQHKEAEHLRRLTLLENDRKGRQPFEDSQTLIHLQETDAHNKDLQRDLATGKEEANAIGKELERKEGELQLLQTQCAETQVLLEEARQKATLIQNEKLSAEKQAVVEREEMRSQLSKAASLELANLKSKHLDLIQQSKAKDSPIAEKYREAANQLILTRQEKERVEREATTTKTALETLQKEWQDEAASAERFRQQLIKLQKQAQEKDALYEGLQQKLQGEIADNKAKDGYIKAILAHENEKKKPLRSPAVRESGVSMTLPPHQATVVKDSQPIEHLHFASHTDIMGIVDPGFDLGGTPDENLFEAFRGPEDLTGLFPDTPKQLRTVEVTNVSYSRSRVSSRESGEKPKGQKLQSGLVRQPSEQIGSRIKESSHASKSRDATSRRPHLNPSASDPSSTKSPPKSSQRQRATQQTTNAPRGILKQANQDLRGQKRPAVDTEVFSAAGFTAAKRRKSSAPTNGLGPIIADSQSPAKGVGGRGRKQATRHSTKPKKDDRFLQTFKGYTNNGQLNESQ